MNMFPNEVGTSANIDGGGISAHDLEHGQTCFVPDVFIDESEARAFTERLNTLQVSPIHLIDVIEDALGV